MNCALPCDEYVANADLRNTMVANRHCCESLLMRVFFRDAIDNLDERQRKAGCMPPKGRKGSEGNNYVAFFSRVKTKRLCLLLRLVVYGLASSQFGLADRGSLTI
jgi:hypothetical protein